MTRERWLQLRKIQREFFPGSYIVSKAVFEEKERTLLESVNYGGVMKDNIEKLIDEACGRPENEILNEKVYWQRENALEEKRKRGLTPLTESQKKLADEACEIERDTISHSLDAQIEAAFGSGIESSSRIRDLQESIGRPSEGRILLESATIDLFDSNGSKPFKFSGKAFQVDHVNKNNRRYPRNLVEGALKAAKGRRLSVCSGHPSAGATDPSLVVGRITLSEIGPDGWIRYSGTLSETRKGKDLQILLKDKNIGDVSLRSRGKTNSVLVDGESIEEVVALSIKGLDLVTEGSFTGAGVENIL